MFPLGTAWLALALQHGLLPLHGGKDVYAFAALSGNSKATIGTALSARG